VLPALLCLASLQAFADPAQILQVGPSRQFTRPSEAAAIAHDGDIIEIDAGTYPGDVAVWGASRLVLRGVGTPGSGRARMAADGRSAQDKAIWVIQGDDVRVENIEFTGAAAGAGNGAGIRAEGNNLTIVNCDFHDNQEGILTTIGKVAGTIDIENSIFARDGGDGGFAHEIYVGNNVRQLIVRGSYFHLGNIGHLIKSRAQRSLIEANRITDETGTASYEIEFPNGGLAIVRSNMIEQGQTTQNPVMLAYGFEGPLNADQRLYVINNTFVNDLGRGSFIMVAEPGNATVVNNIFVGSGAVLTGHGTLSHNLVARRAGPVLVDAPGFDYHLTKSSPAIGVGADPGTADGAPLLPAYAYVDTAQSRPVAIAAPIDAGAFQH
jgi:hypothetical protein